ncbi:MAG: hypothetical protein QNL04_09075 [SAR324 cluster bacterium]|nr:hypothetical protein [SAR324 cluster bacterium]
MSKRLTWKRHFLLLLLVTFVCINATQQAWAKGLNDELKATKDMPQVVQKYLESMYLSKSSAQDQTKELKKMLEKSNKAGDRFFAFHLLGRFAAGEGIPEKNKAAGWLEAAQEDALEILTDNLNEDDLSISEREMTVYAIGRVAASTATASPDINKDALEGLVKSANGDQLLLSRAAVPLLGKVILLQGKNWEDLSEQAGDTLMKELESADPTRKRYAIVATIQFLRNLKLVKGAEPLNEATKEVWEELNDQLDDIDSVQLQIDLKRLVTILAAKRKEPAFKSLIKKSQSIVNGYELKPKAFSGKINEILEQFKEEDDLEDLDAATAQALKLSRPERDLLLILLQAAASAPENPMHRLRAQYFAIFKLSNDANSNLAFSQVGRFYLSQLYQRQSDQKGLVAIGALSSLLASTDQSPLVLPLLEEITDSINYKLPYWAQRRLVSLVFLSAADSPNDQVNEAAFKLLLHIRKNTLQMGLAWEVQQRLKFLSKSASNKRVMRLAAEALNQGKS